MANVIAKAERDNGARYDTTAIDFRTALAPDLRAAGLAALEAPFRMELARLADLRFEPAADVAATLAELHALNVPCAALSGGWAALDQRKCDRAGFTGPIVFTEDLGIAPDSPGAFAAVAQTLRLPVEHIWFIGTDPLREIVPAGAVGMQTIWIDRDGTDFPADHRAPDATVTTFSEILDELSGPYTRGLLALRHVLRTSLAWRPGHFVPTNAPGKNNSVD